MLFPLTRKLHWVAILWDKQGVPSVQRHLFKPGRILGLCFSKMTWIRLMAMADLCITGSDFMYFLSRGTKRPYQWCSGPLPIQGCTHTSRPCTGRVQRSESGRYVLHRSVPPSLLHTGISLSNRHRGCHSPGYTALHRITKIHNVKQQIHTANRFCTETKFNHFCTNITHQLDGIWDFLTQYRPYTIWLPPSLAVTCKIIYLFGVGTATMTALHMGGQRV